MKKAILFYLVILSFAVKAQNRDIETLKAQSELNRRGEVYFNFNINNTDDIKDLTKKISIDKIVGNTVYAYANSKQFDLFTQSDYNFAILTAPSELFEVKMTDNPRQVLDWDSYPTYQAYDTMMTQFARNYPQICKLIVVKTLNSGRRILAVRISDNVDVEENEPEFLYSSTIHGDETTGYILMLHLIDYLLSNYGTNDRVTNMVNNVNIVICPNANPDGTYKGGNNTVNGATRSNANNVDLNRNYPDPEDGPHPDGNAYQPETVAFMNFASANTFTLGANFHGGTEVVNYPWDTWSKLTADNNWWVFNSRMYVDTVHANAPANYMRDYDNGITNGYAWYSISGGRQDYMNYFQHCREVTIEISDIKLLPASQLVPHWNYNYRSFLNHIEQATYGLHGLVTDSITGAPLKAKIFINNFDKDSSFIYTDPQVGDYHRMLKAGNYSVTYSASGYVSKTFQVQISDMQTTVLDVQLYDGRLIADFVSDTAKIAVDGIVHFSDKSLGSPQNRIWTFEGGNPSVSTELNPVVSYDKPGFYSVKLVVSRQGASDTLQKEQYIEVKPWYIMSNKTYSLCEGRFLDSGGPSGNYSNDEMHTITFIPTDMVSVMTATFVSMDIEKNGENCDNDKLSVYNGTTTAHPLIGVYCGNTLPATIVSTDPSRALTFVFQSNQTIAAQGWDINLLCKDYTGIKLYDKICPFTVYPNPIVSSEINVLSYQQINSIVIRDISGNTLLTAHPEKVSPSVSCNLSSGIYLLQAEIDGRWFSQKFIVAR